MLVGVGQRCGDDTVSERTEGRFSGAVRQTQANQDEAEVGGVRAPTLGGNTYICWVATQECCCIVLYRYISRAG
jgi:hypothetical protein